MALGIQHAMRIIILLSVACVAVQYVSHYLLNSTTSEEKKVIEHKMCVLIFCTTFSETFLILSRTERDVIKIVYWSTCKEPIILVLKLTLNHKPNSMTQLNIPCSSVNHVIRMSMFTSYFYNLLSP